MICNRWVVDKYSPKRKRKTVIFIAGPSANEGMARENLEIELRAGHKVENLHRCTGTIRAEFDGNYGGEQVGDPWITYECDQCHTLIEDDRLPTIETLDAHLQKLVDALL